MASAKAIYYGDEKTKQLLDIENEKKPIAIQIFGSDITSMKEATKYVSSFADILDINMGCPAPKVVKNGDGSRLLLNLDLAGKIVEEVVKNSTVPVTVKFRKGWNDESIVAVKAAQIFEAAGASAITIHGRTREQYYSGNVDLDIIKAVKQSVKIPVIGNGDIKTEKDAFNMFEYTGVDGIMCGRGALGSPWIFQQIISFLQTGKKLEEPNIKTKNQIINKHLQLCIEQKGEKTAIREMRKHISWYIKNLKDASLIRDKINKIEDKKELIDCITEYFNSL